MLRPNIIFFIISLCLSFLTAKASVSSITSSDNLVTGENCYVTFIVEMDETTSLTQPEIVIKNTFFQLHDTDILVQSGQRYYRLIYRFNSPNVGTFIIPRVMFSSATGDHFSEPIKLTVRDKNSLVKKQLSSKPIEQTSQENIQRRTFPYYTQLIAQKTTLFPNEVTRLEYKVYIPKRINVVQWGLPSGEKENATAWRFETPSPYVINGDVVIDGITYQVGRFHTTTSGIKSGKATLGPFKSRIIHNSSEINTSGSFIEAQELRPVSNTLDLEILNLPSNPSTDFKGDVGNFQMKVDVSSKSKLTTTESIKVDVTIIGRGKFAELSPPSLTNDDNWKLISQTKRDLGDYRKNIDTFAQFTYLLQPKNAQPTHTPGLIFSYLDPESKSYKTLSHPGIPITVVMADDASPDPALNELTEMRDLIEDSAITYPIWYQKLPSSLLHIVPGSISLLLLFYYAYKKHQASRFNRAHEIIKRKAFRKLSSYTGEDFLKHTNNYIQRWVDEEKHPEFIEVQQLRDDHCYKPNSPIKLSEKRKDAIIDSLRKLLILFFFIAPQLTDAAENEITLDTDYQQSLIKYKAHPTQKSADILYNIGTCYQHLDKPGKAAASYHRALLIDPYHLQSKHNLGLIHSEFSSITSNDLVKPNSPQDWIRTFSVNTYYVLLSLSLWLILISVLWLKIIRPKRKTICFSLILFSLCVTILSAYSYHKHPNKNKLTGPPFAVLTSLSELSEYPLTGSTIINTLPIASECYILSYRGTYSYIETANKTKGWTLTSNIEKIR